MGAIVALETWVRMFNEYSRVVLVDQPFSGKNYYQITYFTVGRWINLEHLLHCSA